MTNDQIGQLFKFISQVLGMDSKNHFRARAYEEAGVVIHQLDEELTEKFAKLQQKDAKTAEAEFARQLDELPGIGESISAKLVELLTTGKIKAFAQYTVNLPGGMYSLVQLYGIGAKKALKLCKKFKLNDPNTAVERLLEEAKQGNLRDIAGFGEKSEQELIRLLTEQHQKSRIPRNEALKIAKQLKQTLLKIPQVKRVIFLGSLRRGAETVGDIDLGAIVTDVEPVRKQLKKLDLVERLLVAGDNMIRMVLANDWQVDLKISPADEWGSFVQHFTGGKEHNIRLREFAMAKGLSLSEHGIKDKKSGQVAKFTNETDFYKYLGLKLIPPEERIGKDEIEQYSSN